MNKLEARANNVFVYSLSQQVTQFLIETHFSIIESQLVQQ